MEPSDHSNGHKFESIPNSSIPNIKNTKNKPKKTSS